MGVRRIEGVAWGWRAHSLTSALLLLVLSACTFDPSASTSAIFVVEVVDERFSVLLTRAETIQQAQELMESGESRVLMGRLAAGDGGFNLGYDWHLEPDSVGFHDVAVELCDGLPSNVERTSSTGSVRWEPTAPGTVASSGKFERELPPGLITLLPTLGAAMPAEACEWQRDRGRASASRYIEQGMTVTGLMD
jgi:hypothetical protein